MLYNTTHDWSPVYSEISVDAPVDILAVTSAIEIAGTGAHFPYGFLIVQSFVPGERITCTGLLRNVGVITFVTNYSHTLGFSKQS
jgi:hypothetical protein